MDPAAFSPYTPHQGGLRPQFANNGGPRTPQRGGQIPQGSKLASYMNRGQSSVGYSGPNSAAAQMSQMAADLNNLGLDHNTLKKLSMTGIREFMPPATTPGSNNDSGSNSPYPNNFSGSQQPPARLQPPANSFASSPRTSPTPPIIAQQTAMADQGHEQAGISTYSDGGTTYFYSGDEMPLGDGLNNGVAGPGQAQSHILLPNYSMFSGTPNFVANMKVRNNVPAFVAESELKLEILKRHHVCAAEANPDVCGPLPASVDNYSHLCPLEPAPASPMHKSQTFGYVTSVYKATNAKTGRHIALRRIHGYKLANTKCMVLVDQWKKLQHSNLVALRQVFTTKAFNDHSMLFAYDFYPGAETLMARHFTNPAQVGGPNPYADPYTGDIGGRSVFGSGQKLRHQQSMQLTQNGLLAESLIWTYVIQMTSALRQIHSAGLACRTLDPTKILVTSKTRLLLNCCGIFDVLTFDPTAANPTAAMAHYQQDDLIALGKIVLALACNSFMAIQRENLQTSMEIVTSTYSSDMRNLIMYLLTNPTRVKSVNDLMPMIGARFYSQLDAALMHNDVIEAELAKEVESSRMFRILTELCTVVDREELNGDYGWAEYGDRYMLKLFRDYVFHQITEDSKPWLDMAHVIGCLNRLDAGVSEKICLMSRDEQNVLVVSYSELRQCLEQSFMECVQAQRNGPSSSVSAYST